MPAGLFELGHNTQDHVGNIEGNMRDQYGSKPQCNPKRDKKQHQGDTHDNLSVQHRDIGKSHVESAEFLFHSLNTDSSCGPYDSGSESGNQCDQESAVECVHYGVVLKEFIVPFQGSAAPLCSLSWRR